MKIARKSHPDKIGDIVEKVLSARGYLTEFQEWTIHEKWMEIVGEKLAAESECRGVENGILYIRVKSASWRQEMSFFKQAIMEKILKHTKCRSIKDIVFC